MTIYAAEVSFGRIVNIYSGSVSDTYLSCSPYTDAGKISKYPVSLNYIAVDKKESINSSGSIYYLCDGNIGKADIYINNRYRYKIQIRLVGLSLTIKRVDRTDDKGNTVQVYPA